MAGRLPASTTRCVQRPIQRVAAAFAMPAPLLAQAASLGDPITVLPIASTSCGTGSWLRICHVRWAIARWSRSTRCHGERASRPARGVTSRGRVRFADRTHTVVGLSGTTVHLVDDIGVASLMLFSHLVASAGFELLDSKPEAVSVPPFGLLDTVPGSAVRKARFWERHLIEIETGVPPDAPEGTTPRVEYDLHKLRGANKKRQT